MADHEKLAALRAEIRKLQRTPPNREEAQASIRATSLSKAAAGKPSLEWKSDVEKPHFSVQLPPVDDLIFWLFSDLITEKLLGLVDEIDLSAGISNEKRELRIAALRAKIEEITE